MEMIESQGKRNNLQAYYVPRPSLIQRNCTWAVKRRELMVDEWALPILLSGARLPGGLIGIKTAPGSVYC